jgi:hypothetical protein
MRRRDFVATAAVPLLGGFSAEATPPMEQRIDALGFNWNVISAADWRVSGALSDEVLELVTARPQQQNPRRPIQFALARTEPFDSFQMEVEVKRQPVKGSLILVYAWEKEGFFNYVHLSSDPASAVAVHNGIFHCAGGDRIRLSAKEGPATLVDDNWHEVKIRFNASSGEVVAWVDGVTSPSLTAVDPSLRRGLIGLGSFFDVASFRRLRLKRA